MDNGQLSYIESPYITDFGSNCNRAVNFDADYFYATAPVTSHSLTPPPPTSTTSYYNSSASSTSSEDNNNNSSCINNKSYNNNNNNTNLTDNNNNNIINVYEGNSPERVDPSSPSFDKLFWVDTPLDLNPDELFPNHSNVPDNNVSHLEHFWGAGTQSSPESTDSGCHSSNPQMEVPEIFMGKPGGQKGSNEYLLDTQSNDMLYQNIDPFEPNHASMTVDARSVYSSEPADTSTPFAKLEPSTEMDIVGQIYENDPNFSLESTLEFSRESGVLNGPTNFDADLPSNLATIPHDTLLQDLMNQASDLNSSILSFMEFDPSADVATANENDTIIPYSGYSNFTKSSDNSLLVENEMAIIDELVGNLKSSCPNKIDSNLTNTTNVGSTDSHFNNEILSEKYQDSVKRNDSNVNKRAKFVQPNTPSHSTLFSDLEYLYNLDFLANDSISNDTSTSNTATIDNDLLVASNLDLVHYLEEQAAICSTAYKDSNLTAMNNINKDCNNENGIGHDTDFAIKNDQISTYLSNLETDIENDEMPKLRSDLSNDRAKRLPPTLSFPMAVIKRKKGDFSSPSDLQEKNFILSFETNHDGFNTDLNKGLLANNTLSQKTPVDLDIIKKNLQQRGIIKSPISQNAQIESNAKKTYNMNANYTSADIIVQNRNLASVDRNIKIVPKPSIPVANDKTYNKSYKYTSQTPLKKISPYFPTNNINTCQYTYNNNSNIIDRNSPISLVNAIKSATNINNNINDHSSHLINNQTQLANLVKRSVQHQTKNGISQLPCTRLLTSNNAPISTTLNIKPLSMAQAINKTNGITQNNLNNFDGLTKVHNLNPIMINPSNHNDNIPNRLSILNNAQNALPNPVNAQKLSSNVGKAYNTIDKNYHLNPVGLESFNSIINNNNNNNITLNGSISPISSTNYDNNDLADIQKEFLGIGEQKQQKKLERMIKNRESASLSRKRKKEYVKSLEDKVSQLLNEKRELELLNVTLKTKINSLENENQILKKVLPLLKANKPGVFFCLTFLATLYYLLFLPTSTKIARPLLLTSLPYNNATSSKLDTSSRLLQNYPFKNEISKNLPEIINSRQFYANSNQYVSPHFVDHDKRGNTHLEKTLNTLDPRANGAINIHSSYNATSLLNNNLTLKIFENASQPYLKLYNSTIANGTTIGKNYNSLNPNFNNLSDEFDENYPFLDYFQTSPFHLRHFSRILRAHLIQFMTERENLSQNCSGNDRNISALYLNATTSLGSVKNASHGLNLSLKEMVLGKSAKNLHPSFNLINISRNNDTWINSSNANRDELKFNINNGYPMYRYIQKLIRHLALNWNENYFDFDEAFIDPAPYFEASSKTTPDFAPPFFAPFFPIRNAFISSLKSIKKAKIRHDHHVNNNKYNKGYMESGRNENYDGKGSQLRNYHMTNRAKRVRELPRENTIGTGFENIVTANNFEPRGQMRNNSKRANPLLAYYKALTYKRINQNSRPNQTANLNNSTINLTGVKSDFKLFSNLDMDSKMSIVWANFMLEYFKNVRVIHSNNGTNIQICHIL